MRAGNPETRIAASKAVTKTDSQSGPETGREQSDILLLFGQPRLQPQEVKGTRQ